MATDRSASRYQGLLIPDSRITVANITDQGTGNTDSDFSQGGPRPGVPKPSADTDLILQATGSQSAKGHLEVYTQRAGHAGRDGAGFLWRDVAAGETTSQRKGWDPYSVFTGWEALLVSKTATENAHPAIIRLANGKLIATGTQTGAGGGQFQTFYVYDPSTGLWDTNSLTLPSSTEQTGAALVELPSGRLLWIGRAANTTQVEVRYSDDEFGSWATASSRALNVACGGAILKAVAAYSAGEVGLWLLWDNGGTQTLSQYASDDLGLRFTRVVDDWNAEIENDIPAGPAAIAAEGGGFLLGFVKQTVNSHNVVWSISSAFVAQSATKVTVNSRATVHPLADDAPLALWRDESGAVFLMGHSDGTSSTPDGECSIFASYDDGRTWAAYNEAEGFDVDSTDSAPAFREYAVASTSGRAVMITRWDAGTADHDPGSLCVLYLGGYGRQTAPISDSGTEFTDADGIGFSPQTGGSGDGFMWVPIEFPDSAGWTDTGGGGADVDQETRTDLLPLSAIVLNTDSTSDEINYKRTLTATQQVFAQFAVTIGAGSGDQSADDIAVKVRISAGPGSSYEVRYRFDTAGWTIVDPSGPTEKGSVATGTTTAKGLVLHRVAISIPETGSPSFQTWYASHAHVLEWTAGPSGTLGNQSTPADSALEFGIFSAKGDVANWHHMAICGWGDRWSPTSETRIGDSSDWSNPDSLHPRNMPPLALPALIDGKTKIAAIDGPTVEAETWDILTDYDSPIDHAIDSHGPRIAWQSVSESAQEIVWDLHNLGGASASSLLNSSIGCALLGCNFKTANLQYWTGAAWSNLIALDAAEGFDALKFTRSGNVITVDTGSANTAGRYLNYDDVRGATWSHAGGKSRKILTQTEGAWTDSTTKRPRLLLDGIDGSEGASGDCEIWFKDMCGIAHEITVTPRYIRLQIPASQGTVAGYYEIGQIVIGSLLIFGHQPSRGFSTSTEQGTAITDLADGSTRATRTGPPRRALELSWDDGVDASQTQAASAVPDYVAGTSGGLPVATRSDIARTLEGALSGAASADVPVVYIGRIPTDATRPDTMNNPRQFLYGRASGEYRREHVTGDETVSEVDRIAKITITEVV